MPSRRHEHVIDPIACKIGELGKLPVYPALLRDDVAGWQEEQENSAFQLANVWGRLHIDSPELPEPGILQGPVLLVDDVAESRWSITVATRVLLEAGSGPVLPFVLRSR